MAYSRNSDPHLAKSLNDGDDPARALYCDSDEQWRQSVNKDLPAFRDETNDDEHSVSGGSSGSAAPTNACARLGRRLLPPGGIAASAFNLASATLGAGALALPQAFAQAGDAISIVMLVISCLATIYSIRLLVMVVERTGYHTYEEIGEKLIHRHFKTAVAVFVIAFCWGVTMVYVVGIGNVLASFDDMHGYPTVFKGEWGNRLITIIFWALFMLPLSLLKEINSLRYASLIGMMSCIFLVIAIIAHSASHNYGFSRMKAAVWNFGMLEALPVFSFSYCCQTNAFEVYAELKQRSVRKMTKLTAISMSACTLIYVSAGVAGYAEFGSRVKSDILDDYGDPPRKAYIIAAIIAISFTLTMAFPICIFPTRDAIVQLLGYRNAYETPSKIRVAVCAGLATSSLAVALFVPNLTMLLGILGGLFGSVLGYILPTVFAWKSGEWTRETVGLGDVIGTWALLIGGVVCAIGGTSATIYNSV